MKSKTVLAFIIAVSLGTVCGFAQPTGPIFPTTIQSGGFTKYDTNGYPYVNATGITIDTSSLTNLTVNTATNVSSVLTDRTNTAFITATGGLLTALEGTNNVVHVAGMPTTTSTNAYITGGTNYSWILNDALTYADIGSNGLGSASSKPIWTTNTIGSDAATPIWTTNSGMTITQTSTPLYTLGTNSVGGFTAACTNTTTIATNAHTVGMAITSGEITNFFRVNGGSALLQTLTWTQFSQTNSDAKMFWFFSRPVTAVTNAALWGPTEADMMYLCASPVYLGCSTNELIPFGTSGFAQFASGLARPMVNTWTNRELYYVVTQPTVVSAANTSNVVTTARIRVAGLQD